MPKEQIHASGSVCFPFVLGCWCDFESYLGFKFSIHRKLWIRKVQRNACLERQGFPKKAVTANNTKNVTTHLSTLLLYTTEFYIFASLNGSEGAQLRDTVGNYEVH